MSADVDEGGGTDPRPMLQQRGGPRLSQSRKIGHEGGTPRRISQPLLGFDTLAGPAGILIRLLGGELTLEREGVRQGARVAAAQQREWTSAPNAQGNRAKSWGRCCR